MFTITPSSTRRPLVAAGVAALLFATAACSSTPERAAPTAELSPPTTAEPAALPNPPKIAPDLEIEPVAADVETPVQDDDASTDVALAADLPSQVNPAVIDVATFIELWADTNWTGAGIELHEVGRLDTNQGSILGLDPTLASWNGTAGVASTVMLAFEPDSEEVVQFVVEVPLTSISDNPLELGAIAKTIGIASGVNAIDAEAVGLQMLNEASNTLGAVYSNELSICLANNAAGDKLSLFVSRLDYGDCSASLQP